MQQLRLSILEQVCSSNFPPLPTLPLTLLTSILIMNIILSSAHLAYWLSHRKFQYQIHFQIHMLTFSIWLLLNFANSFIYCLHAKYLVFLWDPKTPLPSPPLPSPPLPSPPLPSPPLFFFFPNATLCDALPMMKGQHLVHLQILCQLVCLLSITQSSFLF